VKEKFANDKLMETNLSSGEVKKLANDWEIQEKFYTMNDLRLRSYRAGKKSFDKCVKQGRK